MLFPFGRIRMPGLFGERRFPPRHGLLHLCEDAFVHAIELELISRILVDRSQLELGAFGQSRKDEIWVILVADIYRIHVDNGIDVLLSGLLVLRIMTGLTF
jgi:hypothetical protein